MNMVFCRGCGKEIHEEAPMCPHCGAPQHLVTKKSTMALVFFGIFWTFVFWFVSLIITGFVMGLSGYADSAQSTGEMMALPYLIIAAALSGYFTKNRKLPGTK